MGSKRITRHIDYSTFNSTGEKILKSDIVDLSNKFEEISLSDTNMTEQLKIDISVLTEELQDFIEEHPFNVDFLSNDEIDKYINQISDYRTKLRKKHKELKNTYTNYDDEYSNQLNEALNEIKIYIGTGNDIRHKIRMKQHMQEEYARINDAKQVDFVSQDVLRQLDEVEDEITVNITELSDDEVITRTNDVKVLLKKLNGVSTKIPVLIQAGNGEEAVTRYDKLALLLTNYEGDLKKECSEREVKKENLFKEAKLNIKLGKFKGYESTQDIYTFQDTFEKLYAKTTPKRLMPDLIRNNHLEDPALSLVNSVECIDEIWSRLKQAYGKPKIILNNKLKQLKKVDALWKCKDPSKVAESLGKLISVMRDLMKLCGKHKIEASLYYGSAIEEIYKIMGDSRVTRWLAASCEEQLSEPEVWTELLKFLEKDLKVQQNKILVWKKSDSKDSSSDSKSERNKRGNFHSQQNDLDDEPQKTTYQQSYGPNQSTKSNPKPDDNLICAICQEPGHFVSTGPFGSKLIQYYTCPKFAEMTPLQRFLEVKKKGLCFQCLFPNALQTDRKHYQGRCQREFACQHQSHSGYRRSKHVLVCEEHKHLPENEELLQKYKERCILRNKSPNLPNHAKEIKLSFHTTSHPSNTTQRKKFETSADTINNAAIYQLQQIEVDGQIFTIFYDSGCADFISRKDAIEKLGSRARLEYEGPIQIGGVGDISTVTKHGIYTVQLPLKDDSTATMTGVCLDKITSTFPTYPIEGKVSNDIAAAYQNSGGYIQNLPKLPKSVGGDVHFMIGIKYLRYHPKEIFQLPSGLTVYQSMFKNSSGGDGIIGGPHEVFTAIERHFKLNNNHHSTFLCDQLSIYRNGYQVNPDLSIIGYKSNQLNMDLALNQKVGEESIGHEVYQSRKFKLFNKVEDTGTIINYRCINCRSCQTCKNHDEVEEMSIREEVEQHVINDSVTVNLQQRSTVAKLPFMHDPKVKLLPNKHKAMKVYQQQLRKLSRNPKDRDDVIKSEAKLQELGHVDYVKNLSESQQAMLNESDVQNYIAWRAIWKSNSLTTPCRIVFDASQMTDSGYSMNDLLAKGINNMNKLQEMLIRWRSHRVGIHTDIQKMYNSVKLVEKDWIYQRYIWHEDLDPTKQPEQKVIKTLIYGVRSSGNQAERGLRLTAKLSKDAYPDVHNIICKDTYVDDCLTGEDSQEKARATADNLEIVLNKGGFTLKGISMSGKPPPEKLSDDSESICVAGMKWYPKDDLLSLDINPLCFSKKIRGRKIFNEDSMQIPTQLTRRHCISKVSEIFDLVGNVMPVISSLKLDLHEMVKRKMDWDDVLPDNLRKLWINNFEMIQELKNLRYQRTVVPDDAVSLDINTLDFGDASTQMACAAVYARFQKSDGSFSCQLVLSRSKIIPENTTQPRAELIAALLNAFTGEIVRRAFGEKHKHQVKISDSQIVLYWLINEQRRLKQWVRNRVLEVRRLTDVKNWYYIETSQMIADLGTRKGATIKDVENSSTWINGHPWMLLPHNEMPLQKINDVTIEDKNIQEALKESACNPIVQLVHNVTISTDDIILRYQFSNYLIDPNKFYFTKVVRILSLVLKFIRKLKRCKSLTSPDQEIKEAELYFYKKATLEVKKFNKESKYSKFSKEKDEILWYTGRILPENEVTIAGKFTDAMKDLSSVSFCVPVVDRFSPIAFSIVNDVHWNSKIAKHSGVETVLREVLKKVFVIEGRQLVKKFRKCCIRCRFLNKKMIDVAMGSISPTNLIIAPIFYVTQTDLAGPFQAFSQHHKRTTVKIWFVVFCCNTTSCVNIKVMEDYSATAFINAFIRFSCEVGYPKMMLTDEGSQLVKGCENMKLNFTDMKKNLYQNVGVEYDVCPVGGHNFHGKVERKIKEIKSSIEKSLNNERLSILMWETVVSEIANSINDMPLALGNIVADYESMDLITPNRLKLGRNNNRSPDGVMTVTNNPSKILKSNEKIFNSWFEVWLMTHVPKLMHHPKWYNTSYNLKEGDIVLFLKHDSSLQSKYQYGVIKTAVPDKDGQVRKVTVRYRNENENIDRETYRSARQLVMIHGIEELDIIQEINRIGCIHDLHRK